MDLINNPLDGLNFDPVAFINSKFPTEGSLEDLESFTAGISSQIESLDEEISTTVHSQAHSGEKAKEDIANARTAIAELFDIVVQIKEKAGKSEETVQELCADIRRLDCAKSHLQTTITSLKRLQMLITAVSQLEEWKALPLKQVANMLEAVKQLLTHFLGYTTVPKIKTLVDVVASIEKVLTVHVEGRFSALGDISMGLGESEDVQILSETCLVVDALGSSVRIPILKSLVERQLQPYDKLFSSQGQHFSLEDVERRWAWFKRMAKSMDAHFLNVIPSNWQVLRTFCVQFCEMTKAHIEVLLRDSGAKHDPLPGHPALTKEATATTAEHGPNGSRASHTPSSSSSSKASSLPSGSGGGSTPASGLSSSAHVSVDVSALLKALQTTLRFEEEMSKRFEKPQEGAEERGVAGGDMREAMRDTAFRTRETPSSSAASAGESTAGGADDMERSFPRIAGSISSQFDGFLKPYVTLERTNLSEMIMRVTREESDALDALSRAAALDPSEKEDIGYVAPAAVVNEAGVLHSSTSMFVFVKNSIRRCTALSSGQTFYLLSLEFTATLSKYASWLANKLPVPLTHATTQQVTYRLNGPIADICHVVNTCEYCAEVVPTLEAMIKAKIHSEYVDGVNLNAVTEEYLDLSARAAKTLVGSLVTRLDVGFKAMTSINWGTLEHVGEESAYTHSWQKVLVSEIPAVRTALSTAGPYFKNVCTKLATAFVAQYLAVILKQRKISEAATHQLLLDTHSLKTLLLHLHSLGMDTSHGDTAAAPPVMYTRVVTTKITHVETVLKLIGTAESMLVERFRIMWPKGTGSDLATILALKGSRRADQQRLLEDFSQQTGTAVSKVVDTNMVDRGLGGFKQMFQSVPSSSS